MFWRILIRSAMKYFFYNNTATAQHQYEWQRHVLWQFTAKVIESKSGSHWHKECPTACTEETTSLVNHQITSDFGGQHWAISDTNLNAVWSWKKKVTVILCVKAAVPRDMIQVNYILSPNSVVYALQCEQSHHSWKEMLKLFYFQYFHLICLVALSF